MDHSDSVLYLVMRQIFPAIRPISDTWVGEVNSGTLVGGRPVHAIVLAISYACTHSDSVPYLIMRRIFPPIQTDIRHVGR